MQKAKWTKDAADERGKWVYGETGWMIFKWRTGGYRVYAPNKQMVPALTLKAAKQYVENKTA